MRFKGLAISMAVTALLLTACGASPKGTINNGFGANDASADVTVGSCTTNYGTISCGLNITNHSGGTSDYYVEASVLDTSGANVGSANAVASNVEAGQAAKTTLDGVFTGPAKGVTVKLTQIQRTASA